MKLKALMLRVFVLLLSLSVVAQEPKASPHHWSYEGNEGPSHWHDLNPDYALCKVGKEQSPIDILNSNKETLPPIRFEYKPGPLSIINNGHTIQINYAPGSFMMVGDKRYELRQFHFHHPSEERFQGKEHAMDIHFVHADSNGKLAVIAVQLHVGQTNPSLQMIWQNLPGTEGEAQSVPGVEIDASSLLPQNASYYTFAGSLTTPPCTEGVTWYVLKSPVDVSAEQVEAFGKLYPHNARPVQALNGRVIRESD